MLQDLPIDAWKIKNTAICLFSSLVFFLFLTILKQSYVPWCSILRIRELKTFKSFCYECHIFQLRTVARTVSISWCLSLFFWVRLASPDKCSVSCSTAWLDRNFRSFSRSKHSYNFFLYCLFYLFLSLVYTWAVSQDRDWSWAGETR